MEHAERGFTLGEILGHDKGDSPAAQLYRIWLDLFHSGAEYEDKFRQLPFYDRYIWLVSRFSSEVENGGIDQFLFNSSGDYVMETLEALAAIGASKSHRALEQACELFPNGRPSGTTRVVRIKSAKSSPGLAAATLMKVLLSGSWSRT